MNRNQYTSFWHYEPPLAGWSWCSAWQLFCWSPVHSVVKVLLLCLCSPSILDMSVSPLSQEGRFIQELTGTFFMSLPCVHISPLLSLCLSPSISRDVPPLAQSSSGSCVLWPVFHCFFMSSTSTGHLSCAFLSDLAPPQKGLFKVSLVYPSCILLPRTISHSLHISKWTHHLH